MMDFKGLLHVIWWSITAYIILKWIYRFFGAALFCYIHVLVNPFFAHSFPSPPLHTRSTPIKRRTSHQSALWSIAAVIIFSWIFSTRPVFAITDLLSGQDSIAVNFLYHQYVDENIQSFSVEQSFEDHLDWWIGSTDLTRAAGGIQPWNHGAMGPWGRGAWLGFLTFIPASNEDVGSNGALWGLYGPVGVKFNFTIKDFVSAFFSEEDALVCDWNSASFHAALILNY